VSLLLRLFGNFSFAQELMPEKWVMISGLFWFRFGMGGWVLLLGYLADQTSIEYVYKISSYLPLIGILFLLTKYKKESCFHLNLVLFMSIRDHFVIF
jgi:FSR family fosmidomycin resistance protein-like MFS transporter